MPLTVYEKHDVKGDSEVLVRGKVSFNVLNQPRTPKPTAQVPNPKPEFVITIDYPKFKGNEKLIAALKDTLYGDNNEHISLRSKSPFSPSIVDNNNQVSSGEEVIPEGKALKNEQEVIVHVKTFDTPQNLGCGFDAVKIGSSMEDIALQNAGGAVDASVFEDSDSAVEWE